MIEAELPANEAQRCAFIHERLKVLNTPLEDRFERITRMVCFMLKVPISAVSIVVDDVQWFKSIQGLNATGTARGVAFCAHTILGEDTFVVPDARTDERFHDNPLVTEDPNIRFYAGQPLTLGDGLHIGALCAIDRVPRELGEDEMQMLRDLGKLVERELISQEITESFSGLVQEVEEAKRAALIDPLTRVWNRAGMEQILAREWKRASRVGGPVAVLSIDLDGFKQINDTHGHPVGDAALRQAAKFLLGALRETDVVGRWGGDEFLAVMPDCGDEGLQRVRETLQQKQQTLAIEAHRTPDDRPIPIRFSVGGATAVPGDQTLQALIERADQSMYQVKRAGSQGRGGEAR
jgi:diguanylate cyclase (GGDEF)-like protein